MVFRFISLFLNILSSNLVFNADSTRVHVVHQKIQEYRRHNMRRETTTEINLKEKK
jgi:hypothetical protein